MKELNEIELYEEIRERYTTLYMLLDDCVEDDKNGELEEVINAQKQQIVTLVKLASHFGVDSLDINDFEEIKNHTTIKNWYDVCKNKLQELEK